MTPQKAMNSRLETPRRSSSSMNQFDFRMADASFRLGGRRGEGAASTSAEGRVSSEAEGFRAVRGGSVGVCSGSTESRFTSPPNETHLGAAQWREP